MSNLRSLLTYLALCVATLFGCDSNPTPHPQTHDAYGGGDKVPPGRTDQPNEGAIDPNGEFSGEDGDHQDPSATPDAGTNNEGDVPAVPAVCDVVEGDSAESPDGDDAVGEDAGGEVGDDATPCGESSGNAAAPGTPDDSVVP